MKIQLWGVRGSIASGGATTSRIGGNTSCVEVVHDQTRIIFDAGSGIRGLGEALMESGKPVRASLIFSHLHWDHVQGFPFFAPAYRPDASLALYGPGDGGGDALRAALERQMQPPGFPVPFSIMGAALNFQDAKPGETFAVGSMTVRAFSLPHPNGCQGYRVDAPTGSFVYATDVEVNADTLPPDAADAMADADVLCLDAQYMPEEYEGHRGPCRKGWGHSTMLEAARIAQRVRARRLLLFHHDPSHSDAQVEAMAEDAREVFPASEPAREGQRIELGRAARRSA
jgi:phosphoribosyl 1,2-cyclic phosphodiesterase